MAVYENVYRRWEGERRGPLFRWLAIPRFVLLDYYDRRVFIFFLSAACMQFLARLAYIYLMVNKEFLSMLPFLANNLLPVDAAFFKNMLDIQVFFCLSLAFLLGSGLMSRDFEHHAVVLYFSKPISRTEYFVGKFSVLTIIFLLVTWLQAMILYGIQAMIGSDIMWRSYYVLPWPITLYSLLIGVTLNLMILAASCLARNARYAGVLYAITFIGLGIVGRVVSNIENTDSYMAISPLHSLFNLGDRVFHLINVEDPNTIGAGSAWACVLACWAVSGLIIKVRLDVAARRGR